MATVKIFKRQAWMVFLGALVLAPSAIADYKKSYGLGLKAYAQGDWSGVQRHMREALAERPEPVARARLTGMEIKPYVPQVYLAWALAQSAQCATTSGLLAQAGVAAVSAQVAEIGQLSRQVQEKCASATPAGNLANTQPKVEIKPTARPVAIASTPAANTTAASTLPVNKTPLVSAPVVKPVAAKPATKNSIPPKAAAVNASRVTPPELQAIATLMLQGDYARASTFNVEAISERRAQAFALALRAAAKLMSAQVDPSLATQLRGSAVVDLKRARGLDPALKLNSLAFSPKIRGALN